MEEKRRIHEQNEDDDGFPRDPRVLWAHKMENTLKRERQQITSEMKRSWGLYNGDGHWNKNRPKWKVRATINYCFWVPTQWAATLADNKPRATFSAYDRKDQRDADIMSAAWVDVYERRSWQEVIRNAILISRVEKKSFLRLTYDPWINNGDGDMVLKAIPGNQVYLNAGATTLDEADVLMYEYEESLGSVLQKYPHLASRLKRWQMRNQDQEDNDNVSVPSQTWVQPSSNATKFMPPYNAAGSPPEQSQGTRGVPVKEFWTRPKGPKSFHEVDALVFNVGNEPASEPKTITFEDGFEEPLQIVVTEGNIVYELPYSQAELLEYAAKFGGIKVLARYDAVQVFRRKKKVNLYPGGRRMVVVGDFVADDGMNPFAHHDWPFIAISAYPDPKRFWGLSDIDLIYELNEYVNRLYSLFLDAAILTSNPIWRIPLASEISDEDITNAPGAVMREDPNSLKLGKREPGPDMPGYLMETLKFGIERIKEISGLSEIATGGGKMPKNAASEAVSMYQEQAGIRFRDAHHDIDRAIARLGQQFKGMVAQFYTSPRIARIKNASGIDETVQFFGASITTPMTLEVKAGSMLPQSPTARYNMLMTLLNSPKPVIDLKEVWGLLADMGVIDSATALEARIRKERANPDDNWMVSMPPPPKGGGPGQSKGQQPKKPGGKSDSKGNI
jgi:hypothetical protein